MGGQRFACTFCDKWIDKTADAWTETERLIYDPTYVGWTKKIKALAHTTCMDQERTKREEAQAQWRRDEAHRNEERRRRLAERRERRRQWWRSLWTRLRRRADITVP
jgi:hypothetical protein